MFVPRDKHFFHTREGGANISHTQEGGGDKHFSHTGGTNIFALRGGQTFFVGGGGGHDDVDEEMYVSKAKFLVSKASKLSAGARILGARRGPEILVLE